MASIVNGQTGGSRHVLFPDSISVYAQQHYVDVYPSYIVVRSEYWFLNRTMRRQPVPAACLAPMVGAYWPRYRVDGQSWQVPDAITPDTVPRLQPGISQVECYYGVRLLPHGHRSTVMLSVLPSERPGGAVWIRRGEGLPDTAVVLPAPAGVRSDGRHWYIPIAGGAQAVDRIPIAVNFAAPKPFRPNRVSWERHYAQLKSWTPDSLLLQTMKPVAARAAHSATTSSALWMVALAAAMVAAAAIIGWWRFRRHAAQR